MENDWKNEEKRAGSWGVGGRPTTTAEKGRKSEGLKNGLEWKCGHEKWNKIEKESIAGLEKGKKKELEVEFWLGRKKERMDLYGRLSWEPEEKGFRNGSLA